MSEVKYIICDCCGAKITNQYWGIDIKKGGNVKLVETSHLDLCEKCEFMLRKLLDKNKTQTNEIHNNSKTDKISKSILKL